MKRKLKCVVYIRKRNTQLELNTLGGSFNSLFIIFVLNIIFVCNNLCFLSVLSSLRQILKKVGLKNINL